MLATQVQYWQLQENIMHNRNTEAETQRTNKENESISWFNARENQRHNKESESISWFNAYENQRHNYATESLGQQQLKLGYAQLGEQTRHNRETEYVAMKNANVNLMNAQTNRMNAYTQARQVEYTYSLGLEANRISQQNADTNVRNAITNERNAATREFEAQTSRYAAEAKAGVDLFNAATRANELENQKQRTAIEQSRFELDTSKFHWQQGMDITNTILHIGDTVLKNADQIKSTWNSLQFATALGGL